MLKATLVDASKCIGCRACQVACKQWNHLAAEQTSFTGYYENPVRFTAYSLTRLVFRETESPSTGEIKWYFSKQGCMHCTEAACEKVCPAAAISHNDMGAVVINQRKCIGCNYCVASCTFHVMAFNQKQNVSQKCTQCSDRQALGLIPACVKACPTGALGFGSRSDIASKAHHRLIELMDKGVKKAQIYGLSELDGMGVIYILEDTPEVYGLPARPRVPVSAYVWNVLFRPLRILVVLGLGFALWNNKKEAEKLDTLE